MNEKQTRMLRNPGSFLTQSNVEFAQFSER